MSERIINWINKLENNEEVTILSLTEIFSLYPDIILDSLLPSSFLLLENWIIKSITTLKLEDNQTIEQIIFEVDTFGTWVFNNGVFSLENISIKIEINRPESEEINYLVYIYGDMTGDSTIVFPVVIRTNEPELEDAEGDTGWLLSMRSGSIGDTSIEFSDFKTFIGITTLEEIIPEYFGEFEEVDISKFTITFSPEMNEMEVIAFNIFYDNWPLIELLNIVVNNSELNIILEMPYDNENSNVFLEGSLVIGDKEFPRVRIDLPDEFSDEFSVKMIDYGYTIGEVSFLDSLPGDFFLTSILPSEFLNFSDLTLKEFYLSSDFNNLGINEIYLSVIAGEDENTEWTIIPGILKLTGLSLEFYYNPIKIVIHGKVLIGDSCIPLMVKYISNDSSGVPSDFTLELDPQNATKNLPVNLIDLATLGFAPSNFFPGMESFTFNLYDFLLKISMNESPSIETFDFKIETLNTWTIMPEVEIKNVSVEFSHQILNDETGEETYEILTEGIFKLADHNDIVVQLTIPSEGNWIVNMINDEGVELPSLNLLDNIFRVELITYLPSNIFTEGAVINDFHMEFLHPAEGKISSLAIELLSEDVINLSDIFILENLSFIMNADFTTAETNYNGSIACTMKLGTATIPIIMPLPYNSQQYTFQLYDNATLSTLSDFISLVKFNPNYYLSLLPGFEIPSEITISRFDIKLDDETNEVEKLQVTADFGEGVTISLPPGLEITMNSLDFVVTNAGSYYNQDEFIVRGAITETIGSDTTIYVKIRKEDRHWHVTMDMAEGDKLFIGGSLLENIIPGLNIPYKIDFLSEYVGGCVG